MKPSWAYFLVYKRFLIICTSTNYIAAIEKSKVMN